MGIAYSQDFEAEASKLGPLLVDAAAAGLVLRSDWLSGEIFAEDGPGGFNATNSVVAADKLEFGRRLLLC